MVCNTPLVGRQQGNLITKPGGVPVAQYSVLAASADARLIFLSRDGDNFTDHREFGGQFVPVAYSQEEWKAHYMGIANGDLWKAFHPHTFEDVPESDSDTWNTYKGVNSRIADAILDQTTDDPEATVWVHDFQMLSVGASLQAKHEDMRNTGFFWHIPFPKPEQMKKRLPPAVLQEVMQWFSAYKVVGFHTEEYAANYKTLARELGIKEASHVLVQPISVDVGVIQEKARRAFSLDFRFGDDRLNKIFGLGKHERVNPCIEMGTLERGDPIKGGIQKIRAKLMLAQNNPEIFADQTCVEVLSPSRMDDPAYAKYCEQMKEMGIALNEHLHMRTGRPDQYMHYIEQGLQYDDAIAALSLSDSATVLSLDDGYNMVAAEVLNGWMAAGKGALGNKRMLLSSMTGFSMSLQENGYTHAIPTAQGPINSGALLKPLYHFMRGEVDPPKEQDLRAYFRTHTIQHWVISNLEAISASIPPLNFPSSRTKV